MTAVERMNALLLSATPDQIDSSDFWHDLLRQHLGASNASNLNDRSYGDALLFMYLGARLLDEIVGILPDEQVWSIFEEHVQAFNQMELGFWLKKSRKIPS